MTREEALRRVKGYLTDCLPIDCYGEVEEIIKALEQEPFINKSCVSSGVCEHDKSMVLDKIRAEIEIWRKDDTNWSDIRLMNIEDIIDKYKTKSEEEDGNDD